MESRKTFKMTYSSKEQEEIEAIRLKYSPKSESKLERLRSLDRKVGRKATTLSIIVGICGTLIMGIGMSLVMTDFGKALEAAALPLGIALGSAGIVLLALAYPIYEHTLKKERERIAPEILRLTDELMK